MDNSKKEPLSLEQKACKMFIQRLGITEEEFVEHEIILKNTFAYRICLYHISLMEITNKIYDMFKENQIDHYQFEEEKPVSISNHHKYHFTQQKVQHQVTERKPKHLIKKIIR